MVNQFLEIVGWLGARAPGDGAAVADASTGKTGPPTARLARRERRVLARNITADIRRQSERPSAFSTVQLAAIRKRTGVFGVKFSGFIAWWLWRAIHLSKLPRLEKTLRVAVDWSLDLLFSKDIVGFLWPPKPLGPHEYTPLQRV